MFGVKARRRVGIAAVLEFWVQVAVRTGLDLHEQAVNAEELGLEQHPLGQ